MSTAHHASCHCGCVELQVQLSDGFNTARRCSCSFCKRRGAIAVSAAYPDGVKILKGKDVLTLYQWGTKTAEHYFCSKCGIYTHHRRRSNPNQYGVNVAVIEDVDPSALGEVPWVDGVNHPSDR